jgi:hypothetical protein
VAEFLTGAELDRIEQEGGGGEVIDPSTVFLDEPKGAATTAAPKLDALLARVSVSAEPPPAAPAGAPLAKQLTRRLSQREREQREREELLLRLDEWLDEYDDEDEE